MTAFEELATLTNPSVPDLSPGVGSLLSLMASDDVEMEEAARALELHPVIAARLIGLANSAWSSPVKEVMNLVDACVRLGLSVIKSASIAYAVAAPFNGARCPSFDPIRFWCCSLLAAEAAGIIGEGQGLNASFAKTAAMMSNLGLVWLADAAPDPTQEALELAAQHPEGASLGELLTDKVGVSHRQATHHLLKVWNLSADLCDANDPQSMAPLATVCRAGARLAADVYLGVEPGTADVLLEPLEEVERVVTRLQKAVERTAAIAQSIAA